ncbi:hypothetical protein ES703_124735 [subsurface metagenome]
MKKRGGKARQGGISISFDYPKEEEEEFEITGLWSLIKGLVPQSPDKGPPFPRMFGIRWPILREIEEED